MSISGWTFNWFDLVVLAVIGIGLFRGRRRGMSEELLDVVKWLVVLVVGGLVYRPVGNAVSDFTHLSAVPAYITAYVSVIVASRLLFGWIQRVSGEKLVASDIFGGYEYYLGMIAGAVRYTCYLLVGLAILNAKYISPEDLAAEARMQRDNFGDISFPTIGSLQQSVFVGSASGPFVKNYLARELITTAPGDGYTGSRETLASQREHTIDEVLGARK